jgi:hypothetical protein
MHFQIPSCLQQELLAYDPKLKALVKEQEPKKTTKKAKYPLGNIPHLIPENVVRGSYQQDAIDRINSSGVSERYHRFTKVVDVATPQARTITIAILYHFEQCWYAAWLPAKGEDYIYGYAYAFKNTAAAAKVLPRHIWNTKDRCTEHASTRGAQTFTYSRTITKQDIIAGNDARNWRAMGIASYYQKSRDMNDAINSFESTLMETIPTWNDSHSMFDRIKCNNLLDALEFPFALTNCIEDRSVFKLTVDNIVDLANAWTAKNNYTSLTYLTINDIQHIITTPFIKKRLQTMLDRSVEQYNNVDNELRKAIKYGYKEFEQTTNSIYFINRVWPDCPLDHYRTYFAELRQVNLNHLRTSDELIVWLREHMSVTSFLNMMRKYSEKSNEEKSASARSLIHSDYNYFVHSWYEMNDTFSMIMRILEAGKTLEPPKRWRMPDFHDYVQAEAWKIQNKKESLHQDLFPAPVHVEMNGHSWTFLQPIDTHQLAQWGQAVRNCVGSASQYAEDIKKRKHFIVLCMIDGRPTFTIQLDVSMGVMNVKQIAGVANQRLNEEQREEYALAFKQALQSREKQLRSES